MCAAQIEHQPADGIGRVAAIIEYIGKCLVTPLPLVAAKSDQQVSKGSKWDREFADCLAQGDKHWMVRLARVTSAQLLFPPVQQTEAAIGIMHLVGQVIGPAAIGINRVEMWTQRPRQQGAGHMEILVVRGGQGTAIGLAIGQ